jgi:UDP-glucose 4-epimerase
MKLKVLVTGAAGDIGSRLSKALSVRDGVELYTTALEPLDGVDSFHQVFDVRDESFLSWVKQIKPDVVVHLASIIKLPAGMTIEDAHDIDVKATDKLLQACLSVDVKKFIVTSSGAAYGYWRDNPEWLTEDMPVRGNKDYFYSDHKRQVEELLAGYRETHPHLQQVVLRPGTVLGPNFENPITNMFEKKVISGIKNCDSPFVIIWVDDLVQYLVESCVSDIQGVFNVAGDGVLSLQDIAKRLNKPFIAIPAFLIKAVLGCLKPLGLSQYGPEQVKFVQYRPVLSNQKIKQQFRHQPEKTTAQAFEVFLEKSEKEYVNS